MQGERSLKDLVSGLEFFNKLSAKPDLIIIARGGGSLEDLMPFNEEELVTKKSMNQRFQLSLRLVMKPTLLFVT